MQQPALAPAVRRAASRPSWQGGVVRRQRHRYPDSLVFEL